MTGPGTSDPQETGSHAYVRATVHGLDPAAVLLRRGPTGDALFIQVDPDEVVSIRVDLRDPGGLARDRAGLEALARVAVQAAQEIAGLQARRGDQE